KLGQLSVNGVDLLIRGGIRLLAIKHSDLVKDGAHLRRLRFHIYTDPLGTTSLCHLTHDELATIDIHHLIGEHQHRFAALGEILRTGYSPLTCRDTHQRNSREVIPQRRGGSTKGVDGKPHLFTQRRRDGPHLSLHRHGTLTTATA